MGALEESVADDLFPTFPIDDLARQIGVDGSAQAEGVRGLPEKAAVHLSAPERQIVTWFESRVAKTHQTVVAALSDARSRRLRSDLDVKIGEVRQLVAKCSGRLEQLKFDNRPRMEDLTRQKIASARNLNLFKARNNIDRDPMHGDSDWLHYGFIGSIMLFEALLAGLARGGTKAPGPFRDRDVYPGGVSVRWLLLRSGPAQFPFGRTAAH